MSVSFGTDHTMTFTGIVDVEVKPLEFGKWTSGGGLSKATDPANDFVAGVFLRGHQPGEPAAIAVGLVEVWSAEDLASGTVVTFDANHKIVAAVAGNLGVGRVVTPVLADERTTILMPLVYGSLRAD